MPNSDVPAAEIGLSNDNFDDALIRLERDLKSLRSAAATFPDRGRALIERLKAMKANYVAPQTGSAEDADSHLLDAVDRLSELTRFVDCAWLASRSIEGSDARDGLSMVLDHAATGLRKLSKDLYPPASARRSAV